MTRLKLKNKLKASCLLIRSPWIIMAFLLIFAPDSAHAMKPVWQTLQDEPGIQDIWRQVMNLVNYFIVAVLIFVAFAQILRINLNTYGIKKILPALVFAVIAANFSYLICRWLIDLANVVITLLLDFNGNPDPKTIADTPATITEGLKTEWQNPFGSGGSIIVTVLRTVFIFIAGVMILILAFLLYIRNWVIYFLVPLAPLAFMSTVLPQTKSVFNQWWSNLLKWTFMPVVSIFWLWLGSRWIKSMSAGLFGGGDSNMIYLKFAFAILCFYLAITTPFKMGGAVMGQWAGLGKKLWGSTGGKIVGGAKDRVSSWGIEQWAKQGDSKNTLNPLRAIIKAGRLNQEYIEHHKAKTKEYDEKAIASVRTGNKRIRQMINERREYGGNTKKAEATIKAEYQETAKGKKWMAGREKFLAEMGELESRSKHYDTEAKYGVRSNNENAALFESALFHSQIAKAEEAKLAEIDRELVAAFLSKSGSFALTTKKVKREREIDELDENSNPTGRKIKKEIEEEEIDPKNIRNRALLDYFAIMARNKIGEDVVGKLEKDGVTNMIGSQVQVQNMTEALNKIEKEEKRMGELMAKSNELTKEEGDELAKLMDPTNIAKRGQDKEAIDKRARELSTIDHLKDMFDESGRPIGFLGLAKGNKEIAGLMANRAGKHMNVDTQDEAKKYDNDQVSVEQARSEMMGETGNKVKPGAFANWQKGEAWHNNWEDNKEIEYRMFYLNQLARRGTHPLAPDARKTLAGLINNGDVVGASQELNQRLIYKTKDLKRITGDLILPHGMTPENFQQILDETPPDAQGHVDREAIVAKLNRGFSTTQAQSEEAIGHYRKTITSRAAMGSTSREAYAAIAQQKSSGAGMVPSRYLAGEEPAGFYAQPPEQQAALSQEAIKSVIGLAQQTRGSYTDAQALEKTMRATLKDAVRQMGGEVGGQLKRVMRTYSDQVSQTIIQQSGLQMTKGTKEYEDFRKEVGRAIKHNNLDSAVGKINSLVSSRGGDKEFDRSLLLGSPTTQEPAPAQTTPALETQPNDATQPPGGNKTN